MKRIRYVKTKDPKVIKSLRNFKRGKSSFQARINTEDNTYSIVNVNSQRIVSSTEKDNTNPPKNLYTVKEQVKRALKRLGISFEHEFRNLE